MITERELAVLQLRQKGKTQAEIAHILKISQPAVSNFERAAKKKITNAKELLEQLKKLGLLAFFLLLIPFFADDASAVQYITPSNNANQSIGVGNLLFLDNTNGKIGVNTTNPGALLSVDGTTQITGAGTPVSGAGLELNYAATFNGGSGQITVYDRSGSTYKNLLFNAASHEFRASGTQVLNINESGNVGINTTVPNGTLHVKGQKIVLEEPSLDVGAALNFRRGLDTAERNILNIIPSGGSGVFDLAVGQDSSMWRDIYLKTNGADDGLILKATTGHVGINDTTPSYTLDVGGTAQVQSRLYVPEICLNGVCSTTWSGGVSTAGGWTNTTTVVSLSNSANNVSANTLHVDNTNGRVGIGTSSPSTLLHLASSSVNGVHLDLQSTDAGGKTWEIISTGSNNGGGAGNLNFYDGSATALYLRSGVGVGIGTVAPDMNLHIESSNNTFVRIKGSASGNYGAGIYFDIPSLPSSSSANLLIYDDDYTTVPEYADKLVMQTYETPIVFSAYGSTANDTIQFYTGGRNSVNRRMTIHQSGRIGINTTSPASPLHIEFNSSDTSPSVNNVLLIGNTNDTNNNMGGIWFTQTADVGNGAGVMGVHTSHTGGARNSDLALYTTSSNSVGEKVRIKHNGYVGIGTTSPGAVLVVTNNTETLPTPLSSAVLQVAGGTGGTTIMVDSFNGSASLTFRRANNTAGSPSALSSGELIAGIGAIGHTGAAYSSSSMALIGMSADENWNSTAQGTRIIFHTTQSGTTTRGERMRIDNAGRVGINNSAPSYTLDVTGGIRFDGSTSDWVWDSAGGLTPGYLSGVLNVNSQGLSNVDYISFITNAASAGDIRMQNTGDIQWRNAANNGDIVGVLVDASNNMQLMPNSGNVGIGAPSPAGKLHVNGSLGAEIYFDLANENPQLNLRPGVGGSDPTIIWRTSAGAVKASIDAANSGLYIDNNQNTPIIFRTNSGSEKMRIAADGNVGIGTDNPATFKLEVNGTIGPYANNTYGLGSTARRFTTLYANGIDLSSTGSAGITINNAGGGNYASLTLNEGGANKWAVRYSEAAEGYLSFYDYHGAAAPRMVIRDTTGYVGIGTSTPAQKLDVAGNIHLNTSNDTINYIMTPAGQEIALQVGAKGHTEYGVLNTIFSVKGGGYVQVNYTGAGTYQYDPYGEYFHMGYSGIILSNAGGFSGTNPISLISTPGTSITGNVAIGSTLRTWHSSYNGATLSLGTGASVFGHTASPSTAHAAANYYINSTGSDVYMGAAPASDLYQDSGTFVFRTAASGTAGSAISWTSAMYINGSGVGIGTTSPTSSTFAGNTVLHIRNNGVAGGPGVLRLQASGAASGGVIIVEENEPIRFYTNGANERVRITGDGFVGIGTASPTSELHVADTSGANVKIWGDSDNNSAAAAYVVMGYSGSANFAARSWAVGVNDSTGSLVFSTRANAWAAPDDTQSMVITTGGNIGLGASSPKRHLHLSGSAGSDFLLSAPRSSNGGVQTVAFGNEYASDWPSFNEHAQIAGVRENNNETMGLSFATRNASSTNPTERLRITGSGDIGIGTPTPLSKFHLYDTNFNSNYSVTIEGYKSSYLENSAILYVKGNWEYNTGRATDPILKVAAYDDPAGFFILHNGYVGVGDRTPDSKLDVVNAASDADVLQVEDSNGVCEADPEAGAMGWSCSSDERFKKDIAEPSSALNYLLDIPLNDYTLIKTNERKMGPVAQKLQEKHPELVSADENGYLRVQEVTSWQLVRGIQELYDLVDKGNGPRGQQYDDRIAALEQQIASMNETSNRIRVDGSDLVLTFG